MKIEKKIYSYKEICEKIICLSEVDASEYKNIILSLVEYVRDKYNLKDVVVTFNMDANAKANAVTHDGSSIQFKQEMLKKDQQSPARLLDSYITILHEFAHIIDWRQNETKVFDEKRDFISYKSKALLELARYKPEKKDFYETLAYAVYFTGRSEVFARQFALKQSQELTSDLIKLAKSEFKADEYFVNLKKTEHEEEFANLDESTMRNILANKFAQNFNLYRNYLEHTEDLNMDDYRTVQTLDTMEAKNDFVEIANDMLDVNNIDLRFTEDDKGKLAEILFVPGFYDDELAHAFYDYFEKGKEYNACQKIAKIKEFELSSKQEKMLKNGLKSQKNNQEIDFIR